LVEASHFLTAGSCDALAVALADDPFERRHLDDPYPFYARLRAQAADLIEVPERGVFVAARHEVARAVLRDHATYRSGLGVQWIPVEQAGIRATFIENDPPAHTRVRRSVQRWCTPSAMADVADVVDRVVGEAVDGLVASGGGDVMALLARRVPLRVMSEWLGLDLPDAAAAWADASFRLGAPDPPEAATERFAGFLEWAFGEGFAGARAGGLAAAILAGGDEDRLQDDEPFVALASIIIAGLDTTVHLIGNGVAALADNPDQWSFLAADPVSRAPGAVEEILRFDAPVRFFLRRTDDARAVVVLYGSANRDERVFADPDQFLIDRDASVHLAFGSGIHLCLGAPLARLEGTAVFRALAERVASVEVLAGARRTDSAAIRGFATLPVRVVAR
jgi:cytochrome P450